MVYLVFVAAVFCFFSLPHPSTQELTAYDCSNITILAYHVDESALVPSCEAITNSRSIQAEIIERPSPRTVSAYRCHVTYNQSLVDSGGSKRPVSNGTQTIGREACLNAHATKTIVLQRNHVPFLDTNGTIKHIVPNIHPEEVEDQVPEGSERRYHYERAYEITLSKEEGTVDFQRDIAHFGKIACDYSKRSCQDGSGEMFWTCARPELTDILYTGRIVLVTKNESETTPETTYALINSNGKVSALKTLGNSTICKSTEYRTELDGVYILPRSAPKLSFAGTFTADFLSSYQQNEKWKNVYSETTGFEYVDEVAVIKRLCKKEKTEMLRRLSSSLSGEEDREEDLPRKGLRAYSSYMPNYYGIKECAKIKVQVRETDECFMDIPVRDEQNNDRFLKADSRMLASSSERVKCPIENDVTEEKSEETSEPPVYTGYRSDNFDWFILSLGLAFLACLLLCVVMFKWISCCVYNSNHNLEVFQNDQQRAENTPSSNISAFLDVLKPLLPGKKLFGGNCREEQESNVKYAA